VRSRGESLREITLSIGVAVYPQHAETLEEIMRAADRALYEAKHLGRNRVVPAESVLLA
jgi:diguanylate cyclase (GGDEF)-like protein